MAPGDYLRGVLADGARAFRHRAGVRELLGVPDDAGVEVSFVRGMPAPALPYRAPEPGEPYPADDWPDEPGWLDAAGAGLPGTGSDSRAGAVPAARQSIVDTSVVIPGSTPRPAGGATGPDDAVPGPGGPGGPAPSSSPAPGSSGPAGPSGSSGPSGADSAARPSPRPASGAPGPPAGATAPGAAGAPVRTRGMAAGAAASTPPAGAGAAPRRPGTAPGPAGSPSRVPAFPASTPPASTPPAPADSGDPAPGAGAGPAPRGAAPTGGALPPPRAGAIPAGGPRRTRPGSEPAAVGFTGAGVAGAGAIGAEVAGTGVTQNRLAGGGVAGRGGPVGPVAAPARHGRAPGPARDGAGAIPTVQSGRSGTGAPPAGRPHGDGVPGAVVEGTGGFDVGGLAAPYRRTGGRRANQPEVPAPTEPPPPPPQVVVVRQAPPAPAGPPAFWERRYLGRLRGRNLR